MSAIWDKFGPTRPDEDRWWNEWESQVTTLGPLVCDGSHGPHYESRARAYQAEWLEEYKPYRLGAALGRWDAEYQYWRGVHEKLRHFNEARMRVIIFRRSNK